MALNCLSGTIMCSERRRRQSKIGSQRTSLAMCRASTLNFVNSGGIFAAHPWLDGPHDSYLGFTNRGGGALCEHSHALNLWQHFARVAECGEVSQVSADMVFVDDGRVCYDSIAALQLRTDKGLVGRVIQDVVSLPVRKRALIQGSNGAVEWICGWKAGFDAVIVTTNNHPPKIQEIAKTRPEDFILEVKHLEENLNGQATISPIDAKFGISTMDVVNAAFKRTKHQPWCLCHSKTSPQFMRGTS